MRLILKGLDGFIKLGFAPQIEWDEELDEVIVIELIPIPNRPDRDN